MVTDANHYTLGTFIAGMSAYTPAVGDTVYIDLLTTQATFNPATMTAYMAAVYVQAANLLAAAGVTYRLQFGEVGWWFFSRYMSELVGYASWTAPISIGTAAPQYLLPLGRTPLWPACRAIRRRMAHGPSSRL